MYFNALSLCYFLPFSDTTCWESAMDQRRLHHQTSLTLRSFNLLVLPVHHHAVFVKLFIVLLGCLSFFYITTRLIYPFVLLQVPEVTSDLPTWEHEPSPNGTGGDPKQLTARPFLKVSRDSRQSSFEIYRIGPKRT